MQKALLDALFWLMLISGGGSLAACLLLPAWLDQRHAENRISEVQSEVKAIEREVEAARLQIAHLKSDPEYNERFVRQEFNVQTPGVEVVDLSPLLAQQEADLAVNEAESAPTDQLRWANKLESESRENPYITVFLLEHSRPLALLLSAMMFVASLVLMQARGRAGVDAG